MFFFSESSIFLFDGFVFDPSLTPVGDFAANPITGAISEFVTVYLLLFLFYLEKYILSRHPRLTPIILTPTNPKVSAFIDSPVWLWAQSAACVEDPLARLL